MERKPQLGEHKQGVRGPAAETFIIRSGECLVHFNRGFSLKYFVIWRFVRHKYPQI